MVHYGPQLTEQQKIGKDGSLRLCVDYLSPNSFSEVDVYPMPQIDHTEMLHVHCTPSGRCKIHLNT